MNASPEESRPLVGGGGGGSDLDQSRFDRAPARAGWSIGEIAHHLVLAERSITRGVSLTLDRHHLGALSPHFLLGPLNIYQWLTLIAVHEARHRAQIESRLREGMTPGGRPP